MLEETRKRLVDILYDIYEIDKEVIDKVDNLLELNVNSITFIKSIVAIEEEFNIEYPDDMLDIKLVSSVSKLAELIINIKMNK